MFLILGVAYVLTKYLFITFVFLLGLFVALLLGLRLWIEPIKGVCKSKAKLNGKTALVTGGNCGIGLETARDLARRGARVIIASRDEKKSMEAIEDIIKTTGNNKVEFLQLDLAKFRNVRKFAEDFNRKYDRLDILVNNAGCAGLKRRPTEDGIDVVMQVNYFGPFLLTNLLLDKLMASESSRIVIVSSFMHRYGKVTTDNINGLTTDHYLQRYSNSKLCDVMWTKALAKRLPSNVTVNCLHPGAVNTEIFKRFQPWIKNLIKIVLRVFFKSAEEGAQTTLHLCVSEELENVSGLYFTDCKERDVGDVAKNDDLVEEIWKKSLLMTNSLDFAINKNKL